MEQINKHEGQTGNDERKRPNQYGKPYFKKRHHNQHRREEPSRTQKNENSPHEKNYGGNLDIKQASETAKEKLAEALNKKANAVVSILKEGESWDAIIEIIDEEYLPGKELESMSDIIGIYDVKLSNTGELLSWTKKSTRRRGNTSG